MEINTSGNVRFHTLGTGFVKSDSNGNLSADNITIPTVNDAILTIEASTGISLSETPTFTANASTNKTITITNSAPHVATNLGTAVVSTNSRSITSSTGSDITVPVATTTVAGFMSHTDKTKLDGIATGATANTGTVTSVGGTGTVSGITLSGSVSSSGNLTLGGTFSAPISSISDATTSGQSIVKLANPGTAGDYFLRVSRDGSGVFTSEVADASTFRSWIGAGTGNGTVTSVSGTSPIVSSGGTTPAISLADSGVTAASYTAASITVDAKGRVTAASSNTIPTVNDATLTIAASTGISLSATPTFTANASANKTITITNSAPHVATNLGTAVVSTNSRSITSSTGTDITVPVATTTVAGFMSHTDKTKLDGIATGATANTGTVTSVGGTGTVSGLTLSGTVTTSGNLTLGGTLSIAASAITSGVLGTDKGGTGYDTFSNGELLIGNGTLNTLSKTTLTAGSNVTITNAAGSITIAATDTNTTYTAGSGISLSGTQFNVAGGTGLTQDAAGLSLTAITAGNSTVGAVRYNSTTNTAGQFYGGTTNPTSTTRLNYGGEMYASSFTNVRTVDLGTGTGTTTLALTTHQGGILQAKNGSGTRTISIPLNDTFPIGSEIHVVRLGAGEVQFASATGTGERTMYTEGYTGTINTGSRRINNQYQAATLKKISSTEWILVGALKV
jgi:hypothetical protein